MRTKPPLFGFAAIVAVGVVAACGDSPVGVDGFDPQFDHIAVGEALYTFNDLAGVNCLPNGELSVPYHDLVFANGNDIGSCASGAFGNPFGSTALLPFPADLSIALPDLASKVSIETFGAVTLAALDASGGDLGCPTSQATAGSIVTIEVVCDAPIQIEAIGITTVSLSAFLDNLRVTYAPTSTAVTATAELNPTGDKSLKHHKGVFEVVATCSDDSAPTSILLNGEPVAHGDVLDLQVESGKSKVYKKSKKSKKSNKGGKLKAPSFTLVVTCGDGVGPATAEATAEFPPKPGKSGKSKKGG